MLQSVTQRTVMRMILVTTYSQTVNTSSILHILHNLYHVSPSMLAIFNNVLHTITGIKTIVFNIQLDFMLHEELYKFGPHVVPKTMQRRVSEQSKCIMIHLWERRRPCGLAYQWYGVSQ